MSLDKLPEELLIIILKQLDLKSLCNLYNSGNKHIQNVICLQGVIKKCQLSLSSMATVKSLKLDFFKGISKNILHLDLSAVKDLRKTLLLPAMKRLSNLVTLDVAYTNITILNLLDFYEVCPKIKNVTITYQFHKPNTTVTHFPQETLSKCVDLFANFENVHFVGSAENLLSSNLPLFLLQKAKLDTLTYTIAQSDKMFSYYKFVEKKTLCCQKLFINTLFWKIPVRIQHFETTPDIIKDLPFDYEFVYIHECIIEISPVFESFFKDNFICNRTHRKSAFPKCFLVNSDGYLMIWNKETTNFDESFFHNFKSQLQEIEPCVVTCTNNMAPFTLSSDWVCVIQPLLPEKHNKKDDEFEFKRRRISSPSKTINYDDLLKEKGRTQLSVCFYDHIHTPVTLSARSEFLSKLTFLQLRGAVRYSREFFNILFRCCHNLITLDVKGYSISPCAPPIARSIPLSSSLRNLRLNDNNIDLSTLFSSLGQCSKLENIMIVDSSSVPKAVTNAETLLRQCDNLYYLCVCGTMSDTSKAKMISMLNKAKDRYKRHHLFIEVGNMWYSEYFYDPFVNVFKLTVQEDHLVQNILCN